MNEESKKINISFPRPNYQVVILAVLVVALVALGVWVQMLQVKLTETTAKTADKDKLDQVYTYMAAAIQAGVLPDGNKLNTMLQAKQPQPTSQPPVPSPTIKP